MTTRYQKPKGTRDFYPEEMQARKKVFETIKEITSKYGFSEVEAPAIEDFELIKAKSGEEIRQQMFMLEKKGNEQLALRAELTPSLARMFIEKQKELQKPVKWFALSRMWRYEAPQKGRLREFYQTSVELFGSDKANADAECISMAVDFLISLGLTDKDFFVKINNRKLLQGILDGAGIKDVEETLRIIDKAEKLTKEEFEQELKKIKLNEKQAKTIKKIITTNELKTIDEEELNEEAKQGLSELKEVMKLLKHYGKDKYVRFNLSVARGLSYYTGTVYECFNHDESLRAIFGGGRYDNMVEQFGGDKCAATGFAMGDVTLQLLLEQKGKWPIQEKTVDYYIAPVNENVRKEAIEIACKLRKNNIVEIDLMQRKLGKQLEYAASIGAKHIIIVGDEELKNDEAIMRDMQTGKEKRIKISELN